MSDKLAGHVALLQTAGEPPMRKTDHYYGSIVDDFATVSVISSRILDAHSSSRVERIEIRGK